MKGDLGEIMIFFKSGQLVVHCQVENNQKIKVVPLSKELFKLRYFLII